MVTKRPKLLTPTISPSVNDKVKWFINESWYINHYTADYYLDAYYLLYWKLDYFLDQLTQDTIGGVSTTYIAKGGRRYKVVYTENISGLDMDSQIMLSFRLPKDFLNIIPVVLVKRRLK